MRAYENLRIESTNEFIVSPHSVARKSRLTGGVFRGKQNARRRLRKSERRNSKQIIQNEMMNYNWS